MNVEKECAGCGRRLAEGEPVIEVARIWFYCLSICAIPMEFTNEAA